MCESLSLKKKKTSSIFISSFCHGVLCHLLPSDLAYSKSSSSSSLEKLYLTGALARPPAVALEGGGLKVAPSSSESLPFLAFFCKVGGQNGIELSVVVKSHVSYLFAFTAKKKNKLAENVMFHRVSKVFSSYL